MPSGPSLVGFPEPGCWDLTVGTGVSNGTVRVWLEPARPVGLVAAGEGAPAVPGALLPEWLDESAARQVLNAAAGAPLGTTEPPRESVLLYMVWVAGEERFYTPVVYFPGEGDRQAAWVTVQKSLLTGDCRDADVPLAAPVAPQLADRLEQRLGPGLRFTAEEKAPWRLYAAHCRRFEQVNGSGDPACLPERPGYAEAGRSASVRPCRVRPSFGMQDRTEKVENPDFDPNITSSVRSRTCSDGSRMQEWTLSRPTPTSGRVSGGVPGGSFHEPVWANFGTHATSVEPERPRMDTSG